MIQSVILIQLLFSSKVKHIILGASLCIRKPYSLSSFKRFLREITFRRAKDKVMYSALVVLKAISG